MGLYQCEVCLCWFQEINYMKTEDVDRFICNDCIAPYGAEDLGGEFIKLTNN